MPSELQFRVVDALKIEALLARYYPGGVLGAGGSMAPQITPDGTVIWMGTRLDPADDDPNGPPDARQRRLHDRERFTSAVRAHRPIIAEVSRYLGRDKDNPNPTVRGRTWLCSWPVVLATPGEGTAMRQEYALVVTPPGVLLYSGAELLLTTARDLEAEDRDLFGCRLETSALLLNEQQRGTWGPALHSIGRVYWMIVPEQPTKPKKLRKPRPEPPDPGVQIEA